MTTSAFPWETLANFEHGWRFGFGPGRRLFLVKRETSQELRIKQVQNDKLKGSEYLPGFH